MRPLLIPIALKLGYLGAKNIRMRLCVDPESPAFSTTTSTIETTTIPTTSASIDRYLVAPWPTSRDQHALGARVAPVQTRLVSLSLP